MQQVAAVRVLKPARQVIKQIEHQSPEWMSDLHELGCKALGRVPQQHMQRQMRRYLAGLLVSEMLTPLFPEHMAP